MRILFYLFSVACALFLFSRGIGFNGLYGQDSYEYVRYSIALKQFLTTGEVTKLNDFFWPPLYPLAGALLSYIFPLPLSLQLISIVSFAGIFLYLYRILTLLYGTKRTSILFLLIFGFLSPYFFRLSLCVMSDTMAMFLCMASVFHTLNYYIRSKSKDFILSLCLFLLALFTRYSSFIVLFFPFLFLLKHFSGNFQVRTLALSLAAAALILTAIHFIQIDFYTPLKHPLLLHWSFSNYFLSAFNYEDGQLSYRFINAVFVAFIFIHPGFNIAGLLFTVFLLKIKWDKIKIQFILLPLLLYLLFLAGTPNQNIRFLSFTYPLALLLFYPSFEYIYEKYLSSVPIKIMSVTATIVTQLFLIFLSLSTIRQLNLSEKMLAKKIVSMEGNPAIYTNGMSGSLQVYGTKNKIIDLWKMKIDTVIFPSMLLINEKEINEKWKEKFPYQNWKYITSNFMLAPVIKDSSDWHLYEIKRK